MNIRVAQRDDTDALVEFNHAMAVETEGKRLDRDVLRPGVEAVFSDHNKGFYVVATDDDRIVGGLMVTYEWSDWRNAWFWWIQSVYIKPEARGKKLYRQMYEFIKQRARDAGNVCGFRLYVETDNVNARTVYDAVGMQASHYLMYEENMSEPPVLAGGQFEITMTSITEKEFARICNGIYEDRESIIKHNPLGTREEILLWMLLSCLITYLSLSEIETPCFTGKPNAKTYRDAILFVLKDKMKSPFDAEVYLADMTTGDLKC